MRPPLNVRDGAPQGALPRGPAASEGWARRLAGDCAGARAAWARAEADAAPGDAAELVFSPDAASSATPPGPQRRRGRLRARAGARGPRAAAAAGRPAPTSWPASRRRKARSWPTPRPPSPRAPAPRGPAWKPSPTGCTGLPDCGLRVDAAIAGALGITSLRRRVRDRGPPVPAPPAGAEGWLTTLRYAAQEASRSAPRLSPVALAYLERVLERWPAAVHERVLLAEADAASPGAAWGQPRARRGRALRAPPRAGAPARRRRGRRRAPLRGSRPRRVGRRRVPRRRAAPHAGGRARGAARGGRGGAAGLSRGAATAPRCAHVARRARRRRPRGARAAAADPALLQGCPKRRPCRRPTAPRTRAPRCASGSASPGDLACARREAVGGSKDRAKAAARHALAAEPEGPLARSAAILLQDLGEPAAAAGVLRRLSDLAPGDAGLACDAGTAAFLAGDQRAAEASFKRAGAPCGR